MIRPGYLAPLLLDDLFALAEAERRVAVQELAAGARQRDDLVAGGEDLAGRHRVLGRADLHDGRVVVPCWNTSITATVVPADGFAAGGNRGVGGVAAGRRWSSRPASCRTAVARSRCPSAPASPRPRARTGCGSRRRRTGRSEGRAGRVSWSTGSSGRRRAGRRPRSGSRTARASTAPLPPPPLKRLYAANSAMTTPPMARMIVRLRLFGPEAIRSCSPSSRRAGSSSSVEPPGVVVGVVVRRAAASGRRPHVGVRCGVGEHAPGEGDAEVGAPPEPPMTRRRTTVRHRWCRSRCRARGRRR